MSKIVNKLVRSILNRFDSGALSQETGGAAADVGYSSAMPSILRKAGADGAVLLKNDGVLPFDKGTRLAVFGRVQIDYFYVGYGSGGDVKAPYKVNLIDGLKNNENIIINEKLYEIYKDFCTKKGADEGFWGHWPLNFPEMRVTDKIVRDACSESAVALVVIGRAAGEDRENLLKKGSYFLTPKEERMLDKVTAVFKKVVLVINSGNVMDLSFLNKYGDKIGAVLYAWQGGMESGNSIADVLTGVVNPSGRLPDSVAVNYYDYPGANDFGNREFNNYTEDIYVGYRYFETFAKDKVLFPFGYGLSYTEFEITVKNSEIKDGKIILDVKVKNVGARDGREVVQIYCAAPFGKLGKPARVLAAFYKTDVIGKGKETDFSIEIKMDSLSSYDDSGITGNKGCYVMESGKYDILAGNNVRDAKTVFTFEVPETYVTEYLSEVMAVKKENRFYRLAAKSENGKTVLTKELTPVSTKDLKSEISSSIPDFMPKRTCNSMFADVKSGKISLVDFVAELSNEDLEALSRGEGAMNSALGVIGNAGAFCGVTESLRKKGVPPIITTDGPAGIRLKRLCSLLPCGTALAATFDTALIEKIFFMLGDEMLECGTDVILSPGINIHRNPLCGRNFEYYSEDPLLTGKMAAAAVKGVQHDGLSACPKHFACNNQETNRNYNDSRVSERALREIYLKAFEITVKESSPNCIMTSYNKINGVWSHYNYELVEQVLRGEWGYKGVVMTDWWMRYAESPEFKGVFGSAYRVRAGVDVLMPGGRRHNSKAGFGDGTILDENGGLKGITLGELQRTAEKVLNLALKSSAYDKFNK